MGKAKLTAKTKANTETVTETETEANRALFIFRRDFRVKNNPAFTRCARWCAENKAILCPCFIFSAKQVDRASNSYFSERCYAAMRLFLDDLSGSLGNKLTLFYVKGGLADTAVLAELAGSSGGIRAVFFNSDVTPFARDRDLSIGKWCEQNDVLCDPGNPGEGYTVWPCGTIVTKTSKTIPKSFSAFYRYAVRKAVPAEFPLKKSTNVRFGLLPVPKQFATATLPEPIEIRLPKLESISAFSGYGATRDDYNICTTRMSVYLKFGVLGIGETMREVRGIPLPELERQLVWREFYYHLAFGYPTVLGEDGGPNHHIRPDRQTVAWGRTESRVLEKWKRGETGVPLVDQAMRSLRETGWIHNRLRMVVASYLIKDLGVDWRDGEREMARLLIDYDPAQNSGGWQSMDSQIPGQEIKANTQLKKYGRLTNACA